MCGINAIFRYTRVTEEDLQSVARMNREMAYRGPDDEGYWSDDRVALGMRRLSIIGVANGRQPILNETRGIALVANGEIYNHPEIRKRLERGGHRFTTESDCESILHLYEEKGADCVGELRGMFAFVLWDSKRRTLLAARDPVGEKPLYFAEIPTGVVFSSELKAIANHVLTRREPDYETIRQIMDYTFPVDLRNTFLQGVKRLLPGEIALADPEGLRFRRYWSPRFEPTYRGTIENACGDLIDLLRESVDLRFQSEVPVAVMLSGGIDSSAVAALSALGGREVHAITAGYKGQPACDERAAARSLAEERGILWHEIELDEEDFEGFFDEYTAVLDEPVADPVCLPQWGIYKKARELGYKVLLSGTGGDELFFGYPYHNLTAVQRETRLRLESFLPIGDHNRKPFSETFSSEFHRFSRFGRYLFQDELEHFRPFRDYWKTVDCEWPDRMEHRRPDPLQGLAREAESGLDQISAVLFSCWLPANCLHIADKLGMGNSVEVRAPFLDRKLVDFVFSLPVEWRYAENDTKPLLKRALKGLVPDPILKAPKQGFNVPSRFLEHFVQTADRGPLRMDHRHFHTVLVEKVLAHHVKRSPGPRAAPKDGERRGMEAIPVDERLLRRNLELVQRHHPDFFRSLMDCSPSGGYRSVPSQSGRPTLVRILPDGKPLFLHSPENPMKEAMELLRGHSFRGEDLTVLTGFGLGYLPLAVKERMDPGHCLLVLEACPEIFLKACEVMDLRTLLASEGVRICAADRPDLLLDLIEKEQLRVLAGEVNGIVHPPSRSLFPPVYQEAWGRVGRFVDAQRESYRSLEAYVEKSVENVLANLPSIGEAAPVDPLFGKLEGRAALVVAAGPSLDRNIGQLKRFRERFFVVSVDTALKPLLAGGVLPDLVVSVDPNPLNLKKFASIPEETLERLPLVFSPLVFPEIPKRFRGARFVFGAENRLSRWALGLCGNVRELPYGFTVSHFAFYLARLMSAGPILFAGLDLAFSSEGDHARNSAIDWGFDGRSIDLPRVPGVNGELVPTCDGFIRMITLFEREVARTKARCIDASEGGAIIRGTEVMTLRDAAELVPSGSPPLPSRELSRLFDANRWSGAASIRNGLQWIAREGSEVRVCCDPVLSLFRDLDQGHTRGGERGGIDCINEAADRVDRHREFLGVVRDQMGSVFVEQFRLQHQIRRCGEEGERLALEVRKSRIYFERAAKVAATVERIGRQTLSRSDWGLDRVRAVQGRL